MGALYPVVSLSPHILAVAQSLPRGGGYHWDLTGTTGGVLADVVHRGATIVRAGRGSYCSGVTFDVWWRALAMAGAKPDLTVDEMRQLQRRWYCADGGRRGPLDALGPLGLGGSVSTPQPGDFVQLWRRNGTGHTVIALGFDRGALTYLSSQKSTDGIGIRTERPAAYYAVRASVPAGWVA